MNLSNFFYNTFYIKAGKESLYIKCFETGLWINCKSEFEIDDNACIQKIHLKSSNLDQTENKTMPVATRTVNPFNHPRTILHEFELAEKFIRYLIKKLKTNWWQTTRTFIFQLDYTPQGGIADIEARAIKDSLEHSGAREIYIIKPGVSVSEHKVGALYQDISKQGFLSNTKLKPEWQSLVL